MTRTQEPVGDQIRWWRGHRRMTQLGLANRAEASTRHVSFLETGRAKPTRAMLLRLGEHLDIPLRDRNALLLAAGFAPVFPEHTLTDVPMAVVADAIRTILAAHAPMPALAIDAIGDDELRTLRVELAGYPGGVDAAQPGPALVVPLRLRVGERDLAFVSTTTVFGTPLDVAVSELAIETFFPADTATAEYLTARR